MKKVTCLLLMLVMTLTVVCGAAEESAILKLNAFERNVFDALLIMLTDFKDSASIRIVELRDISDNEVLREKYLAGEEVDGKPDSVCVRLTGSSSFEGKVNPYFELCCSTWNEEPRTKEGKDLESIFSAGKKFHYTGTVGDYYEVDKPLAPVPPYNEKWHISNINFALKEYWEMLGF